MWPTRKSNLRAYDHSQDARDTEQVGPISESVTVYTRLVYIEFLTATYFFQQISEKYMTALTHVPDLEY